MSFLQINNIFFYHILFSFHPILVSSFLPLCLFVSIYVVVLFLICYCAPMNLCLFLIKNCYAFKRPVCAKCKYHIHMYVYCITYAHFNFRGKNRKTLFFNLNNESVRIYPKNLYILREYMLFFQ